MLLTIRSDDVSGGYSNYRKALADEILARAQLERAKDLYAHGAIALSDLEVAQDTEDKAKVDVETMSEHLRLLGNNPDKPGGMVDIFAPVSGVITDQQVTNAAASCRRSIRRVRLRFRISLRFGSSATFTKTTWPRCGSAIGPRSL